MARAALAAASLVATAVLLSSAVAVDLTDPADFVTAHGSQFMVRGKPAYFAGANTYDIFTYGSGSGNDLDHYMNATEIDAQMAALAAAGATLLRTWAFNTQTWHGFEPKSGQFNELQFRELDYILDSAARHGLRVVVTLENYWTAYGGITQRLKWVGASASPNAGVFFNNTAAIDSYKQYVAHVVTRNNTVTGRLYADDATVFAWEVMNEPRHQGLGDDVASTTLRAWMDHIGAYIKSLDPNHMISPGIEGHGTQFGYGGAEGNNFTVISSSPYVDFCSAHLYPTASWAGLSQADAVRVVHQWAADCNALGKPMTILEFNVDTKHGSRPEWWSTVFAAIEDAGVAADAFWWYENRPVDGTYGIQTGDKELEVFRAHAAAMRKKSG